MGLNGPSEKSRGEVRSIRLLQLVCLFWLAELVAPLSLLLQARPSGWRLVTVLAGAALFVGCYLWTILDNPLTRPIAWESVQEHSARLWLPFGLLVVLGTVMGGVFGPSWLVLFIFAAVGAAFRLPPAHLGWLIGGLVVLYGGIGLAEQEGIIAVAQFALIIGGSGGGVAVVCYSIRTARELRAARAEVARLAVEAERLRFARDLHDLLGHDLAHIALNSEVGEAYVATAPDQAAAALREVGEVARGALRAVRAALAILLGLQPDLEVVAAVGRGDEIVGAATVTQPDVAVLDVEMPGLDGLEAAAQLRDRLPACKVLILTTFGRPGYLRRAMQSGVVGFLVKEAPGAQLAVAIRRAVAGERIVDPSLAAAALSEGDSPLSEREREVLAATARGASVAAIALTLSLSEGTVRNYLSEAIQKLGARNRSEAARFAEQRGWL